MGHERAGDYVLDEAWDQHLHDLLGATWPCPDRGRMDAHMTEVTARLAALGLKFGRGSYGMYSDADRSLCRAAWCVVVHLRPQVVVETGVARGVTSRVVLGALESNDQGHLWSIDLPHPFNRELHAETGAAVDDACRQRWTYIAGSSRQRLPQLVRGLPHVELFVHDSLHTARNTRFEMDCVSKVMSPGGVMLVDDISTHRGFATFARDHSEFRTMVGPSADQQGLFGIAVKTSGRSR
jgi:Methyltransferase domain